LGEGAEATLYEQAQGGCRESLNTLLAQHEGRGYRPYDPVSIFLLKLWQLSEGWKRNQVIRKMRQLEYAEVVAAMGFRHHYPTEGGLRYIETRLGEQREATGEGIEVQSEEGQWYGVAVQRLNELIVQSVEDS
jgi:hypothetical protein